jgi:tellurite resistance protein TerC
LAIILGFIGVKLILHALHTYHLADWAPWDGEIPIWVSLTVIIVTLTITTVASLVKSKYDQDRLTTGEPSPDESGSDPGVVRGRDRLDGLSD